jgi:hypothetical protein
VPVVVRIGPGIELGWLVAAVGVGMDVVGWYQVSGQPTEAQQLPYLASATIPGAALIVAGAVLIAAGRRAVGNVGAGDAGAGPTGRSTGTGARSGRRDGLWALPDGSYVHRADCPLLDGKPEAFEVTAESAAAGNGSPPTPTRPCPVCDPDPVVAP